LETGTDPALLEEMLEGLLGLARRKEIPGAWRERSQVDILLTRVEILTELAAEGIR
jgi:hypothetical protein